MKVRIEDARAACEQFLIKRGVKKKNARTIVDDYIEGELLGKKSHGLLAFVSGVYNMEETAKKADDKKISIEKERAAFALINGNKQAGQLVANIATNLVVKKAKKCGIAMVGTYNAKGILRPGSQTEYISRHDLVGIMIHNGGSPLVAPYGGIDKVFSTNPIGYAAPTTGLPIVVDMAISERAWGEIGVVKLEKRKLGDNLFINERGNVTQNPDAVFSALPFGGYKGFALGILTEVLTGSLVGNGVGFDKIADADTGQLCRGAFYIAIDPSKFVDMKKFKEDNTALIKLIKKSRKRKGIKDILIPGQRAYALKEKQLKRGWFDLDKSIWEDICAMRDSDV